MSTKMNIPQAPQTEASLIGTILMYPNAFDTAVACGIETSDFYNKPTKTIWNTMNDMNSRGVPITLPTVFDELSSKGTLADAGGTNYLLDLPNAAISVSFVPDYIKVLKEKTLRRGLLKYSTEIAKDARSAEEEISKVIGHYQETLEKVQNFYSNGKYADGTDNSAMNYISSDVFSKDLKAFRSSRIRTNFQYLDNLLGGYLYPGMYTLAATSSLGKTTLMSNIADRIAEQRIPVLYFSIEQSSMELICKSLARLIAMRTGKTVSSLKIRQYWQPGMEESEAMTNGCLLTAEEIKLINESFESYKLWYAPYTYINGSNFGCDLETILKEINLFLQKHEQKPVVIIDYLQIIQKPEGFTGTDLQHTDKCVTELERLAKNKQLTIFVISSVNRASYLKKLSFEALKNSGSIEFSSDVVMTLDLTVLDEIANPEGNPSDTRKQLQDERNAIPRRITLSTLKNRYGRCGETYFSYNPVQDLFRNVEKPLEKSVNPVLNSNFESRSAANHSAPGTTSVGATVSTPRLFTEATDSDADNNPYF